MTYLQLRWISRHHTRLVSGAIVIRREFRCAMLQGLDGVSYLSPGIVREATEIDVTYAIARVSDKSWRIMRLGEVAKLSRISTKIIISTLKSTAQQNVRRLITYRKCITRISHQNTLRRGYEPRFYSM